MLDFSYSTHYRGESSTLNKTNKTLFYHSWYCCHCNLYARIYINPSNLTGNLFLCIILRTKIISKDSLVLHVFPLLFTLTPGRIVAESNGTRTSANALCLSDNQERILFWENVEMIILIRGYWKFARHVIVSVPWLSWPMSSSSKHEIKSVQISPEPFATRTEYVIGFYYTKDDRPYQ